MPIRNRKNLHVTKYSMTTKILINPINKHVYGVEFVKNRRSYTVFARKEVILSAGVFGSAQLLMLSGIGPADHLNSLNIPVIKDLKVGYNLQDHIELGAAITFTIDQNFTIISNRVYDEYNYNTYDYVYNGRGPYTSPAALEALGFINTRLNKETPDFPDIELQFFSAGMGSDAVLPFVSGITDEMYQTVFKPLERKDTFTLLPLLLRPASKGRVKLRSKNPFKHPSIYMNYLKEEIDLEVMLEATKFAIKLALSDEFKKYGTRLHDIPITACKHLEFNSDNYWRCAIRQLTFTNYHQCCTAKMGPDWDPDAVVDPELRVYGVRGLRIVDASIMPIIPSAHIMSTVYAIAEKGADMILNEWRNK
jgi:choline dehydrogenase